MTLGDWPASMSKSTPMRPEDAQRFTNVEKPESDPHVEWSLRPPPVEMAMYFTPDGGERREALAEAIAAPCTPAQFSLPHSPVAKASVIALPPAAERSLVRGLRRAAHTGGRG